MIKSRNGPDGPPGMSAALMPLPNTAQTGVGGRALFLPPLITLAIVESITVLFYTVSGEGSFYATKTIS